MKEQQSRFSRIAIILVCAALIGAAFLHGNHLLGVDVGIMFALVAGGALWLLVKSFVGKDKISLARMFATCALTGFVAFAIAFPTKVNSDLRHFIDKHAAAKAARTELEQAINSDGTFGSLVVSTSTKYKGVLVTISGELPTRDDLNLLRTRLLDECATLKTCVLEWQIRLRESNEVVSGFDHELFPSPKKTCSIVANE